MKFLINWNNQLGLCVPMICRPPAQISCNRYISSINCEVSATLHFLSCARPSCFELEPAYHSWHLSHLSHVPLVHAISFLSHLHLLSLTIPFPKLLQIILVLPSLLQRHIKYDITPRLELDFLSLSSDLLHFRPSLQSGHWHMTSAFGSSSGISWRSWYLPIGDQHQIFSDWDHPAIVQHADMPVHGQSCLRNLHPESRWPGYICDSSNTGIRRKMHESSHGSELTDTHKSSAHKMAVYWEYGTCWSMCVSSLWLCSWIVSESREVCCLWNYSRTEFWFAISEVVRRSTCHPTSESIAKWESPSHSVATEALHGLDCGW